LDKPNPLAARYRIRKEYN